MKYQKLKINLVKTIFAIKIIMFEEILEFKQVTFLCYGRKKVLILLQKDPKPQV
jgi:hypothetical protein